MKNIRKKIILKAVKANALYQMKTSAITEDKSNLSTMCTKKKGQKEK